MSRPSDLPQADSYYSDAQSEKHDQAVEQIVGAQKPQDILVLDAPEQEEYSQFSETPELTDE